MLAVPLVAVLALGASEFEVGLLSALTSAAYLLVGLPAGAWVDRSRNRTMLVVSNLARAAILGTVPLAWWAGVLTVWQLYTVAILTGVFIVFVDVAQQSYLPRLVGRSNLLEANTKLQGIRAVAQIGGPGMAGPIIQVLTAPFALIANVVLLALSAMAIGTIRQAEQKPARESRPTLLGDIREGLRFVLGHQMLRAIAMCNATFNFA